MTRQLLPWCWLLVGVAAYWLIFSLEQRFDLSATTVHLLACLTGILIGCCIARSSDYLRH